MERNTTLSEKISIILTAVFVVTMLVFLLLTATNFWGD
jgi:hypothetical protein